jgi:hypothetical protein
MIRALVLLYYSSFYSMDTRKQRLSATVRSPNGRPVGPRSPPFDVIKVAIDSLTQSLPAELTLPAGSGAGPLISSSVATMVSYQSRCQ